MLCRLCESGRPHPRRGPAGDGAGRGGCLQADHGEVLRQDRAGLPPGGHPQKCGGGQDQRNADHRRGRLLQGQPRRAAPDVRAGCPDDDPDVEPRKRAGQPQRGARRGRGYLALPAQHRDRPEGARLRVFGGDGKAAYDRGREPPVRQGVLGYCRAQHPPLCGQPLQLSGIGTPLSQPDGRDDPGHGGARRSGGPELLQRLPR